MAKRFKPLPSKHTLLYKVIKPFKPSEQYKHEFLKRNRWQKLRYLLPKYKTIIIITAEST